MSGRGVFGPAQPPQHQFKAGALEFRIHTKLRKGGLMQRQISCVCSAMTVIHDESASLRVFGMC